MIPITKLETLDIDGTTSVAPAAILSYSDIQTHLKLDGSADQSLVEGLISAATKRLEAYCDRKFITQVWSIYYDYFPREEKEKWWDGTREGSIKELTEQIDHIDLPFGPCQSIAYIKTVDQDGTEGTVASTAYMVDTVGPVARIALKVGNLWPTTILAPVNGVHIRGTFGFGGTASIPLDVMSAVKITVANMYENRGDMKAAEALPSTAMMLLESYKRWKLGR